MSPCSSPCNVELVHCSSKLLIIHAINSLRALQKKLIAITTLFGVFPIVNLLEMIQKSTNSYLKQYDRNQQYSRLILAFERV